MPYWDVCPLYSLTSRIGDRIKQHQRRIIRPTNTRVSWWYVDICEPTLKKNLKKFRWHCLTRLYLARHHLMFHPQIQQEQQHMRLWPQRSDLFWHSSANPQRERTAQSNHPACQAMHKDYAQSIAMWLIQREAKLQWWNWLLQRVELPIFRKYMSIGHLDFQSMGIMCQH